MVVEMGADEARMQRTASTVRYVVKRDGQTVSFDQSKIAGAIFKAAQAVGGQDRVLADELAAMVTMFLERNFDERPPHIEEIQDTVEKVLIETGHAKTAKAYILYRDKRARIRQGLQVRKPVPQREQLHGHRAAGQHGHAGPARRVGQAHDRPRAGGGGRRGPRPGPRDRQHRRAPRDGQRHDAHLHQPDPRAGGQRALRARPDRTPEEAGRPRHAQVRPAPNHT